MYFCLVAMPLVVKQDAFEKMKRNKKKKKKKKIAN
jgi:hypothetical protein